MILSLSDPVRLVHARNVPQGGMRPTEIKSVKCGVVPLGGMLAIVHALSFTLSNTIDAECFDASKIIRKNNSADTDTKSFVGCSEVGAVLMLLGLVFSDVKLRTTAKHPVTRNRFLHWL